MRKLIVSMNVTVDGYMAGPNCELDWHFNYWDEYMGDELSAELIKADTVLFGRKTYCGMMQHWENLSAQLTVPRADLAFFSKIADCKKVVCSNSLTKASWKNTLLIKNDLYRKLVRLKKAKGANIIVYGSGQLVKWLMQQNLVDEFHLWLHPVIIGSGKLLFSDTAGKQQLLLERTKQFSSGVLLLYYVVMEGKKL